MKYSGSNTTDYIKFVIKITNTSKKHFTDEIN